MSYKYQRLLEVLPDEIEGLEQRITNIENKLMDAELYLNDPKQFQQLTSELGSAKTDISRKVDQWLEVEQMKEKLKD